MISRRRFMMQLGASAAVGLPGAGCQPSTQPALSDAMPDQGAFDPERWREISGQVARRKTPGLVVGPIDALELIESRRLLSRAGFQFGPASATDVFIFSVGEAPSRPQTKVGGLPYLTRTDAWPIDSHGSPLPFVAQFDFRESMDIVGAHAKANLLLIFGDLPSDDVDPDVRLIWKNVATEDDLIGAEDVPVWPAFDAFYATRWRTVNYPAAFSDPDNGSVGSSIIDDAWLACTTFGTQIGPDPFMLSLVPESMMEQVLCCLTPLSPVTEGPFPFLNHPDPLLEIQGLDWKYDPKFRYADEWLTWGDSASLFILIDKDGNERAEFILG